MAASASIRATPKAPARHRRADERALRTDLTEVDVQLIGREGQPGPRRPIPPIGADRLVLHSKNLPLRTEVLLASAAGASWVYCRGALHQPATVALN